MCSGVYFRLAVAFVKGRQQCVELAQRLRGSKRLPSKAEPRTACRIGHPGGQASAILQSLDERLPLPPFGVQLDDSHLLTEQRMQKILDFDQAQIAGIIRQRLLSLAASWGSITNDKVRSDPEY